nr:putative spermatogenesis-associated protein 31C1 [Bubalus bubalis]
MMENFLFSLKSTFDIWLNSCSTYWVTDTILAFLFGLGLFFLFLPYLENNPSFPPPRKHGDIKPQTEPRRRRRSRKKNAAVKACRDCQKELEEIWDLTSLLQTHLGRFPEKGNFHQLSSQEAPGKVSKAEPAGAHQPYREETAPTVSPAPLTEQPLPQACTLSSDSVPSSFSVHSDSSLSASQIPEPFLPLDSLSPQPLAVSPTPPCSPDAVACPGPPTASSVPQPPAAMLNLSQGESVALPLGTVSHRSSLPSPWRPAISGLLHSSCPLSALSWWQGAEKTWSSSTVTHFESQQEHLSSHPVEASFWGDLTNRQVEPGSLSFVNPDVQKLLEILITKRVELKIWKKKGKEVEASFWIIKSKPEQLLGPERAPYAGTLGDRLQKTCSHLFWGLPFLHSESLVATVTVPGSPLELHPILFNKCSKTKPLQIPAKATSQLSLAQPSTSTVARVQPRPLIPTMAQFQPPPQGHMETQAQHLPLTSVLPQYQPQPWVYLETQTQPLPLTPTMPHCQAQTWAHIQTQAQPQPLSTTISQCQPSSRAYMKTQVQPLPLIPAMPHCQAQTWAHIQTQAQPQPLSTTIPQCQPSPQAHMETQVQTLPLTPIMPQCQLSPRFQLETAAHISPSLPIQPSSSKPHIRYGEVSHATVQSKGQTSVPNAIQNLEHHFLIKHLESRKIIPSLVKRYQHVFSQVTHNHSQESRPSQAHISVATPFGDLIRPEVWEKLEHHLSKRFMQQQSDLPCRIQASHKVMQLQGEFPKLCEVQAKKGPSIPSAVLDKSSQDTQKMRSRSSARIPPEKDLCQDIEQSVGKIIKDLYVIPANTTVKVPRVKPESQRELSPDRKHPEDLGVLMGMNTKQIQESPIPVGVHCLRLAANCIVDLSGESNAYQETENLDSSQDGEASMNTFHESLVLSPCVRQELEAYILKFRVTHMWGLLLKVFKFILSLNLRKAHHIPLPGSTLKATCESGDHSKAQSTKIFGKPPQPQAGKRMITAEAASPMETAFSTPSWASEETQRVMGGPLPGGILKASEVPLTRQGDKPPSQTPMYNFVGRIWHNECIMGADKGSLEPLISPSPAMVRNVPQEEAGEWAFPDSYSNVTVVELDERSQSPMEQEAIEGDSGWKSTFEPCLLIKSQSNNMDLRRSQSQKFNKCFSLNTKSVASSLDLHFDAQFRKLECQGFTDGQKEAQGQAIGMLLQDCETGATGTLLKNCPSDMFIAANNLASQESLSCSQTLSSGGTTNSQMLYDASSTGGSSQGQQEVLRWQPQRTCQSKKFVPTDGRGNYRRSKLGQRKKRLAERRAYQACRMNHAGQKKESAESLSKSRQFTLKKGQVPLESHFRIWIKQLLQWIFPNKSKRPEEHLQQGKPVAATTGYSSHHSGHQTQEPVQSRLITEGRAAEAQVLMTAVGKILKEKMVFHYRPHASELHWCQGELWAPFGPRYCYHRFSSYKEQRRVVGDTSCHHQATPMGHCCSKNSEWTSARGIKWAVPPREPGPPLGRACQHRSRVTSVSSHSLHCPRHCLFQK